MTPIVSRKYNYRLLYGTGDVVFDYVPRNEFESVFDFLAFNLERNHSNALIESIDFDEFLNETRVLVSCHAFGSFAPFDRSTVSIVVSNTGDDLSGPATDTIFLSVAAVAIEIMRSVPRFLYKSDPDFRYRKHPDFKIIAGRPVFLNPVIRNPLNEPRPSYAVERFEILFRIRSFPFLILPSNVDALIRSVKLLERLIAD